MVEKLMKDTVKADKSSLPHICSLDWEFNLSSIYVEVDTPMVSISLWKSLFSWQLKFSFDKPVYDIQGRYGTRSTAVLSVRANGEVSFYEKYIEKDQWKEKTVKYHIKKLKKTGWQKSTTQR